MTHLNFESVNTLGDLLSDCIMATPYQSHLKDAQNKKYIIVNKPSAEFFALTPEDMQSLTIHELILHKSQFKDSLNPPHCDLMDKLDQQVCARKVASCSEKNIVFDKAGFLHVLRTIKAPIASHTNRGIVAIMTYAVDSTCQCNLLDLLRLYQQHYPEKQAIHYFFKSLKIDTFFSKLPTYRETMVLLVILFNQSHKAAAKALAITPKTIDVHLHHLRAKLKVAPLQEVLIMMRANSRSFATS